MIDFESLPDAGKRAIAMRAALRGMGLAGWFRAIPVGDRCYLSVAVRHDDRRAISLCFAAGQIDPAWWDASHCDIEVVWESMTSDDLNALVAQVPDPLLDTMLERLRLCGIVPPTVEYC